MKTQIPKFLKHTVLFLLFFCFFGSFRYFPDVFNKSNFPLFSLFWIVFSPVLFLAAALFVKFRSCQSLLYSKPPFLASFSSPDGMSFSYLNDIARKLSDTNKYRIVIQSSEANCVILTDSFSIKNWGFFYPLYLSSNNKILEIGIKSKLNQDQEDNPVRRSKFIEIIKSLEQYFGSPLAIPAQKILQPDWGGWAKNNLLKPIGNYVILEIKATIALLVFIAFVVLLALCIVLYHKMTGSH